MNENNNLEQLQKIAKVLNTDKILTPSDIEQVLAGVLGILTEFKKSTEALNTETKKVVNNIYDNIERRHGEIMSEMDDDIEQKKSNVMADFSAKIEEVRNLLAEIKAIKVIPAKDGISPDKAEIISEVMAQIKLPEYEKVTLDTADQMVGKINELPTDDPDCQIDFAHIKNVPDFAKADKKMLVGGRIFAQMADVAFTNLQNNDVVYWNATRLRFENKPEGQLGVSSVNGLIGNITLAAGAGISVNTSGQTITISATGGGGGGMAIGSPVSGGDPTDILFIDASGNLAQDDGFVFDNVNGIARTALLGGVVLLADRTSANYGLGDIDGVGSGTYLFINDNNGSGGQQIGLNTQNPDAALTIVTKALPIVQPAQFNGSGLNDMNDGGIFTGAESVTYTITITDTSGPDSFSWRGSDGTSGGPTVITTAFNQAIGSFGVIVGFVSDTGHTLSDSWTITVTQPLSFDIKSTIGTTIFSIGNSGETFIQNGQTGNDILWVNPASGSIGGFIFGDVDLGTNHGLMGWQQTNLADSSQWEAFVKGISDTSADATFFKTDQTGLTQIGDVDGLFRTPSTVLFSDPVNNKAGVITDGNVIFKNVAGEVYMQSVGGTGDLMIGDIFGSFGNSFITDFQQGAMAWEGPSGSIGSVNVNGMTMFKPVSVSWDTAAAANNFVQTANFMTVTGNTQINHINNVGWNNGAVIEMYFTGTPLIKNNQTGGGADLAIRTPNNKDLQIIAGDIVTLVNEGSLNKWIVSSVIHSNVFVNSNLVASANLLAQTSANSAVLQYTTPVGADATWQVNAYLNVTAISVNTVTVQVLYQDENNVSQTISFFNMGTTTAAIGATGATSYPPAVIRVKQNTTITIRTTTVGVGSQTYDVGTSILSS